MGELMGQRHGKLVTNKINNYRKKYKVDPTTLTPISLSLDHFLTTVVTSLSFEYCYRDQSATRIADIYMT